MESEKKEPLLRNTRKALVEINPSEYRKRSITNDSFSHIIVPDVVVERERLESQRAVNNLAYSIEREIKNGNPKYNFQIFEDEDYEIYFRSERSPRK